MTKTLNKSTGKIGEDLAADLLIKKGYQILDRNWGNKWGEIDIIARDKDIIVFAEVKTKVGINYGFPEEMVNSRKLTQIQKLGASYPLAKNSPLRIDVVAIILSPNFTLQSIKHYEAVY